MPVHAQNRLLQVLGGSRIDPPPFWFMRQAGRYLPEYRDLREKKGSFLDLVYDPDAAAEVTLQPIRRFGCSAAILFSDILVIPHALGQALRFEAGEGPRLSAIAKEQDLRCLSQERADEHLAPIYETVRRVRANLEKETALIGFCGGLWTVASYMVAGRGGDEQAALKRWAYRDPDSLDRLFAVLERTSVRYLQGQVEAGADALQIFESWAANIPEPVFERYVIAPTRRIVEEVKRTAGFVPIIGFPRGAGGLLGRYVRETGIDAVSLDTGVTPAFAESCLPAGFPVQGNLDPLLVAAGGAMMLEEVRRICDEFSGRPHIFNLGHGFVPDTPVAHVETLIEALGPVDI